MLTKDQKMSRLGKLIFLSISSLYEDYPEKLCIMTKDETWVHHFDPEAKKQSMQWKHPSSSPPKKFKGVSSAGKVMSSIFWDSQGPVVQSIVSLTSLLRVISLTVLADSIHNILIFFAEKM